MKLFSFNEWLGLILALALLGILTYLTRQKMIDAQLVAGALIASLTTVINFFFRKAKPK